MPRKATPDLTQARLKELFVFDEWSGKFFFRYSRGGFSAGHAAGSPDKDGYILICADYRLYRAHRLVWLWFHGVMPSSQIDHIDLDPSNNRIDNLRQASPGQNNQNRASARKESLSGAMGVKFDRRRGTWGSRITADYKCTWLGSFKTKEEAEAAYVAAKRRVHAWNFESVE